MNNKKYNIIFLDIDGVLNGYNFWNVLGWKIIKLFNCNKLRLWYIHTINPFGIHERKVKRLAKIVEATNAKVVMSSSWRKFWWKKPYANQDEDEKKLTDLFDMYNIDVIDITPTLKSGVRGWEIYKWLHEHRDYVKSFVILDDEAADMEPFINSLRFIRTSDVPETAYVQGKADENVGLKRKHIKRAINILRDTNLIELQ